MFENELNQAINAASLAGEYLRARLNTSVDSLEGRDIKLAADKESERIIITALKSTGIPILSEESGLVGSYEAGGLRWIVDPIDGTMNYYRGLTELSCVSVALWEGDEPRLGVINRFAANELWHGAIGAGAFMNGKPIRPSTVTKTKDAVIATGFPVARDYSAESLGKFIKQVQSFKKVRMLGSAALMGVFAASGMVDAYIEEEIMLWDVAAAAAIVKAAGGTALYRPLAGYKCVCSLFSTRELSEDCRRLDTSYER